MHARLAQELKDNNGFVPNLARCTAYLFRCVLCLYVLYVLLMLTAQNHQSTALTHEVGGVLLLASFYASE